MSKHTLIGILLGFGLTVLLFSWLGIGWRILRYPENHFGIDPNLLIAPFIVIGSLGIVAIRLPRLRRLAWVVIATATLSLGALAALRVFDVLLPYEVWLRQGMPLRPF